jgi:hypothetical protein
VTVVTKRTGGASEAEKLWGKRAVGANEAECLRLRQYT